MVLLLVHLRIAYRVQYLGESASYFSQKGRNVVIGNCASLDLQKKWQSSLTSEDDGRSFKKDNYESLLIHGASWAAGGLSLLLFGCTTMLDSISTEPHENVHQTNLATHASKRIARTSDDNRDNRTSKEKQRFCLSDNNFLSTSFPSLPKPSSTPASSYDKSVVATSSSSSKFAAKREHRRHAYEAQPQKGSKKPRPSTPKCASWCSLPTHHDAPCQMDTKIIPCSGPYCITTCDLWDLFVLGPNNKVRPVSCQMYMDGKAYPRGAQVCDDQCLIPEVREERYPAPTGLGVMCRPNTCSPGALPPYLKDYKKNHHHKRDATASDDEALGTLQCPCNWFGSECTDDWIEIKEVRKGHKKYGEMQVTTFIIEDIHQWQKVVQDYRPGGVIRIVHRDDRDGITPREMVAALVNVDTPGELEVLIGPTDPTLREEVRQVAERIRDMPPGPTIIRSSSSSPTLSSVKGEISRDHHLGRDNGGKLYVNPTISGFFNKRYRYLLDVLHTHPEVRHMVIVSTDSGLGGALSAADAALKWGKKKGESRNDIGDNNDDNKSNNNSGVSSIQVHLYYGLRHVDHLPYKDRLTDLVSSKLLDLTLILSNGNGGIGTDSNNSFDRNGNDHQKTRRKDKVSCEPLGSTDALVATAIEKGEAVKNLVESNDSLHMSIPHNDRNGTAKVYTQHAVALDLTSPNGNLHKSGATLQNTVFIICGRVELLQDMPDLLEDICNNADCDVCGDLLDERVFTNV